MNSVIIFLTLLFCHLPIYGASKVSSQPLTLSIFYEALCEDCVRLFQQLRNLLQDKEIIKKVNFDLVPYGKAYQTGTERFSCQHGVSECFFNKIHGCARRDLKYEDSLDFMVCMMANCNNQYHCLFKECTFGGRIDASELLRCAIEDGNAIMNYMGHLSNDFDVVREFVPIVVFNKYYREDLQIQALGNLRDTVLHLLNMSKEKKSDHF